MPSVPAATETIGELLAPSGLRLLGSFHPDPEDGAPAGCCTLLLVGNAGPAMWQAFAAKGTTGPDPLDRWIRGAVDAVAAAVGASALYPFDGPPYLPFLHWALKTGNAFRSPLGLAIHPTFGLWHGYRAALAFHRRLDLPPPGPAENPCETCQSRPCLTACPVEAFARGDYDIAACRSHIASPHGEDCLECGCRARRACPVGRPYVYEPSQARFHMQAFAGPTAR